MTVISLMGKKQMFRKFIYELESTQGRKTLPLPPLIS